ncbi:hypothetical protein [Lentzea albidocapillata]|uniref:Uncharacterized protein n=1 Tax=Lentzea albidocapillata TaxID=40571 RepID=A0A1W2FSR1_9PSEU|nr:hypothetical protein [Lentzea albidocapillata]SMD24955.1 hypothetical protein SAMN05660733_07960 [Lentzea albidocapillata]
MTTFWNAHGAKTFVTASYTIDRYRRRPCGSGFVSARRGRGD